jgi:hypothetical protein
VVPGSTPNSDGGANKGHTGGDESACSGKKERVIVVASGAGTLNASASGAEVEKVLQVLLPAALMEEPGTTCMPMGMGMGMGGQSGAV